VRYFDERVASAREIDELCHKDQDASTEIIKVLQDARCWHQASAQNLGLQGVSLDRLANRFNEFATELGQGSTDPELAAAFAEVQSELDGLRTAGAKAPDAASELVGLVDQGSKLAFQIAMEVARLGPRGERLGPMSQSLEDLTTDFRKVSGRISADEGPAQRWAEGLAELNAKLADLETQAQSAGLNQYEAQARQFGPAAGQLAQNLADMVESHAPQAARLTNIGTDFSQLSGTEFEPDDLGRGDADNPPAGVLSLEDRTPFANEKDTHNEGSIHQPADVDPFAVTPPARADEAPGDPSFTSSVGEPAADIFGSSLDRNELPSLGLDTSFNVKQDAVVEDMEKSPEPRLPVEEEKVYDLDDFGAMPAVADEEPLTTEDDGVYELSDFDAAPVTAADEEQVHDLAAFDAVRLDSPQGDVPAQALVSSQPSSQPSEPEEEIFDLNTFGAVLLN
jgi:hypothetical protein